MRRHSENDWCLRRQISDNRDWLTQAGIDRTCNWISMVKPREAIPMSDELISLVRRAELCGDDSVLDELVHETMQSASLGQLNELADEEEQDAHITTVEAKASAINNDGFVRQIEYLLAAGIEPQRINSALDGRESNQQA
jgi:hypothetical protein